MPGLGAKFLIFKNVMAAGYTTDAVLGLVGSYIGIYFYLRVIQHLFMKEEQPAAASVAASRYAFGATLICLVAAVLIGVFPGWLIG